MIRIKRRRFGQLAIASAATAAVGNLATKTLAQTQGPPLYGLRRDSKGTGVLLQSLNLANGKITDLSKRTAGLTLQPNERLSAFTLLPDGNTFGLATAPATLVTTNKPTKLSSLSFVLDQPQTQTDLPGLSGSTAIESLLATNDNKPLGKTNHFLGIVSLNQGVPPFRLATIDRALGTVSLASELDLPRNQRFSNLTQSPKGIIYATSLGSEGATSLVQFDLENKSVISGKGKLIRLVELSFNKEPLENDLLSLACSPSNQLFALADPTYEGTNSLFLVDQQTGVMTLLRKFDVDKITFGRL